MTDVDALARQLRAGHPEAVREAYGRYAAMVYTLALRSLGAVADAEDVTQQVFVAAWRSRDRFDPDRAPLGAWLIGITRHAVADVHARRARERRQTGAAAATAAPERVADDDAAVVDRVVVAQALSELPAPQRQVLELAVFGDLNHIQIAGRMELPVGAVTSHIALGLRGVRAWTERSDATP